MLHKARIKRLDRREAPLFHVEKVSPALLFSFHRQGKKFSLTVEIVSEVKMLTLNYF